MAPLVLSKASWVSQQRWDALTPEQKGTFANICPDFIVELRSGSDALEPLRTKMKEYIDNGAVLGWLLNLFSATSRDLSTG